MTGPIFRDISDEEWAEIRAEHEKFLTPDLYVRDRRPRYEVTWQVWTVTPWRGGYSQRHRTFWRRKAAERFIELLIRRRERDAYRKAG